ncbi:PHD finger protein 14-like [Actinia tenebrosa]|uniref:PHD finger protein 14-like n=1 Tax=Actinia tenebrosa TaxID=6105 RepID=A0A6P8IAU7_ACTTE|nr:PHD finger protein 14-like [Actinia tenebrosa]
MADKKENNAEEERHRFLQSLLNRGPNKRQIKPVENSPLLQFVLGEDEEDEEEDEDFEFDEHAEAGSGSDYDEQDMDSSNVDNRNEPEDNDGDSEDSEEEVDKGPTLSIGDLIAAMHSKKDQKLEPLKASSDVVICGICMDDVSDEGDEIVECDNCGITVHEGCYGNINEQGSESDKSNDTDSPTEPWFCDACKSGVQPDCELCPNLGGIFKETDTGQWVHLLCALYTPGVAFVKPESLECVTLSELPLYKWGAKECSLCEDERFSRTGVCVGCDAGLCRTYFHVTCAQIHGLLSDVPEECDEDVADPLYAHCKQHADKTITKGRRRAWLAYNARFKKASERKTPEEKERIESCLNEIQKRVKEEKASSPTKALYTPTEKVSRLLSSCPGACRQLFKKAVLLGFTTEQTRDVVNVRRKWFVPPSMTCEFVNYYNDRDARVKDMQERQAKLETNNQQLQEEERKLREKVDKLTGNLHGLTSTLKKHREEGLVLHQLLCQLADQDFSLPEILKTRKTKRKMSETSSKHIQIHPCAKCNEKTNPHLMTECDTCHNYYHLGCVDPPLTRMPRKSAKCLWQCSECDPSESEEEVDVNVDDDTPISKSRQRRTIKEPTKFTPDKGEPQRIKVFRKRKASQDVVNTPEAESAPKKPKVEKRPRKKKEYVRKEKVQDLRTECFKCKRKGDNHTLARCDNCKQCYHFGCLDPPVKSNPKKRGYMWYCTECDESEEEEEETEEKSEKMEVSEEAEEKTKKDEKTTT